MKRIEYTDYEINDLVRTLEYAKKQKKNEYLEGKMSRVQYNYELGLIQDLIKKIPIKVYTKGGLDKDII